MSRLYRPKEPQNRFCCVLHPVETGREENIVLAAEAGGMDPKDHPRNGWALCATHGTWHPVEYWIYIGQLAHPPHARPLLESSYV